MGRYEPDIIPKNNIYLNPTYLCRGKNERIPLYIYNFEDNGTKSLSEVKL